MENTSNNKATAEPENDVKRGKLATCDNNEICRTYGWGKFRPERLQFLNNPKWFLVVIIAYSLCQGMAVLGLLNLVLPTLERRYSFSSKELGLIAASNDISALILVVFISFYGDYASKAKWMGYGAVVTGVGVLLLALPHVMVGKYEPAGTRASSLCSLISNTTSNENLQQCKIASGGEWYYLAAFVGAQLIIGVGNSPYYALVSPYLDEIVEPKSISTYLGILNVFMFTAPGIGYLIGGKLLSIYVDIVQPAGQKLTPKSPGWIGAWWIGFLIFGIAILLCAIFILGFPDEIPGVKERRQKHIRLGHLKQPRGGHSPSIRKIIPELRDLLTNGTYFFSTFSYTVALLYSAPLFIFFSKLLREKFGMDPVKTGYALSVLSVTAILLGNLLGSLTVRMFSLKNTCKKAALMCAVIYLLTAASPSIFLIPGCDNTNLAGVTTPNSVTTIQKRSSLRVTSTCNSHCQCSLKRFAPVCGSKSVTYVNPCYAGCTGILPNKTYTNCSCISSSINSSLPGMARPGYCNRNCKNSLLFLGLCAIILITRASAAVPGKVVTLRCVPDNKRAFANGINYLIIKVFGLLPSPIIFGHLVDLSCRLWQNTCGVKGRCFDYDIVALSRNVCIYGVCVVSFAAILYFLAWYKFKPETTICDVDPRGARENYGVDERPEELSTKF